MKTQHCSLDHLIDQVDMSEFDRETIKAQLHRVEVIVDVFMVGGRGVSRLIKSLTHWHAKAARHH